MHIGPWNSRDFPDMTEMYQPMFVIVGELTDAFFIEGAEGGRSPLAQCPRSDDGRHGPLLMLEDPDTLTSCARLIAGVEGNWLGEIRWMSPPASR